MIRNFKALGLVVLAALATASMLASAAQAQKGVFTAGTTPTTHKPATIVGSQYGEPGVENFFQTEPPNGAKVTCHEANFKGTDADGTATQLTIQAEYIKCFIVGGQAVTVNMNGCDYLFTQPTKLKAGEYTGKADLTCPKGKAIEITIYAFGTSTKGDHNTAACRVKVFATGAVTGTGENEHVVQELGGHVIYRPVANTQVTTNVFRDDITVTANISGISWKREALFFGGCGGLGTGEGNQGIYQNTVTMRALNDPVTSPHTEHLDAWISDEGA